MRISVITFITAAGALVRALPPIGPQYTVANVTTTFDECIDLQNATFTCALSVPGQYRSLQWNVFTPSINNGPSYYCDYICSQSGFERAAFGKDITESPGPASITSTYPKSNVSFFDLKSFYVGCAGLRNMSDLISQYPQYPPPANPIYKNPANCTVKVRGWRNAVAQSLGAPADVVYYHEYKPVLTTTQLLPLQVSSMDQVVLPKQFEHMQYVSVNGTKGPRTLSAPSVYTDNWEYVTYNLTHRL